MLKRMAEKVWAIPFRNLRLLFIMTVYYSVLSNDMTEYMPLGAVLADDAAFVILMFAVYYMLIGPSEDGIRAMYLELYMKEDTVTRNNIQQLAVKIDDERYAHVKTKLIYLSEIFFDVLFIITIALMHIAMYCAITEFEI